MVSKDVGMPLVPSKGVGVPLVINKDVGMLCDQ